MEDRPLDEVRGSNEIARRSLSLFGVVGVALGAPQDTIVNWLQEDGLWDDLTPLELAYVSDPEPTEKQTIDASWKSEALIVLLWVLGKVETLPPANEQVNTSLFQELLPPFAEISVKAFIQSAICRSEETVLKMADELMHLHWEARDARLHSKPGPSHVDIEIIQERHHAINWTLGYEGLPWDEVTTDT